MGIIRNILIAILVISLITFVALFGRLPALRKTPIGWLQRALCLHIPNTLKALDRNVTGGKLSIKGKKLGHYLFFQKNPVVLVSLQKTPRIQAAFDNLFFRFYFSSYSLEVPPCSSTMALMSYQRPCYSPAQY
jgi:hypothetical protein